MSDQTIIGGKQLFDFLQQLPVKVERNVMRSALRAGAAVIRDEARNNVPVLLGALRKSIRVTTGSKNGRVWASVKAGNSVAYYWRWVEFGTKPHLIKVQNDEKPINYRLTAKRGVLTRVSMSTINRNSLMIGHNFIGPTVDHPGAKPHPFMRPALDAKGNAAVEAVRDKIVERLMKEHGFDLPAPEGE
jgi:HK97 gp10 family phage protein